MKNSVSAYMSFAEQTRPICTVAGYLLIPAVALVLAVFGAGMMQSEQGEAILPFVEITANKLSCAFKGTPYFISSTQGAFTKVEGSRLSILPENRKIVLDLSRRQAERKP